MKTVILIICLIASVSATICPAQTNNSPLVQIDAKDFGETNRVAKAAELERIGNTSKIKVKQEGSSAVGESMFVMLAVFEVAKARGYEYFVNLKEWTDKDGGRIYIAGFTNKKNADVKKEFGAQYTPKDQSGEKRIYMSVSQMKLLFPKQAKKQSNPAP